MNMSGVSASTAGRMAGMAGCSGAQHGQMTASKNNASTEKNTDSAGKPLSVDPNLGQAVDLSV